MPQSTLSEYLAVFALNVLDGAFTTTANTLSLIVNAKSAFMRLPGNMIPAVCSDLHELKAAVMGFSVTLKAVLPVRVLFILPFCNYSAHLGRLNRMTKLRERKAFWRVPATHSIMLFAFFARRLFAKANFKAMVNWTCRYHLPYCSYHSVKSILLRVQDIESSSDCMLSARLPGCELTFFCRLRVGIRWTIPR